MLGGKACNVDADFLSQTFRVYSITIYDYFSLAKYNANKNNNKKQITISNTEICPKWLALHTLSWY